MNKEKAFKIIVKILLQVQKEVDENKKYDWEYLLEEIEDVIKEINNLN